MLDWLGKGRQRKQLKKLQEEMASVQTTIDFLDAPQLPSAERDARVSLLRQRLIILRNYEREMQGQLGVLPASTD